MKQSLLIASVLGGGVALGAIGVAGIQALSHKSAPAQVTASQPVAVVAQASAAAATQAAAPAAVTASKPVAAATAPVAAAKPAAPKHASFARVLGSTPITEEVQSTKTECHQVQVERQAPVQDQHRVTGTLLGSVVGGLLGNQVGGGNGKKLATVAGALAGGYAGNQAQDQMQKRDTYTDTENRCMEVPVTTQKVVGYQVRYSLDGKTGTVRMAHKPGKRIPARNGELLLPGSAN
ncbi:glycine zipper 2TM domain-containing protein [Paludibacterium sp. B53371]|uniref:glycine zipper 2TM domain-containing protein n=1 Tax=Paludibacterium sp. B53371 TaxID=2806263 RepID=UPI001C04EED6|nr:glycine zipper 2TM domain-containing protein [Paludibacterium sp. B53371]